MISLLVKVKILDTKGHGGDQDGKRIEQIVAIELPDGTIMGVYDGVEMRISPDMIGKEIDVALMVLAGINGTKIVPFTNPRIEPSLKKNDQFPYDCQGNKYYGKVEEVGLKDIWHPKHGYLQLICINVGVCNIITDIDNKIFNTIKVGDYVELNKTLTEFLCVG
ncbi:MAG: hypothetical protein WBZ29_12755 [Methanocella sp.]